MLGEVGGAGAVAGGACFRCFRLFILCGDGWNARANYPGDGWRLRLGIYISPMVASPIGRGGAGEVARFSTPEIVIDAFGWEETGRSRGEGKYRFHQSLSRNGISGGDGELVFGSERRRRKVFGISRQMESHVVFPGGFSDNACRVRSGFARFDGGKFPPRAIPALPPPRGRGPIRPTHWGISAGNKLRGLREYRALLL